MKTPLISILIPVRDDLNNLKACLESLSRETLESTEVLVCDDGSRDPLSSELLDRIIPGIRLFRISGSGPAGARNHLSQKARGEYLFFVDADTEFSGDTLRQARKIITEHPGLEAFIGSYDDSPGVQTIVSSYKNLSHHYVHHRAAGKVSTFWTGCGIVKRKKFLEFNGFNEHYLRPSIEDIELGMRMAFRGTEILLFPELQVKHNKAWTLAGWLKTDLLLRGVPWVRLMATRKQWLPQLNFTLSHRISAIISILILILPALAVFLPVFWIIWTSLVAGFILLNLGFFSFLSRKAGFWKSLPMIPLHLLYYLTASLALALGLLSAWIQGPLEE